MVFEAKEMDMTLELKNADGESKTFKPMQRVTGAFAGKLVAETQEYIRAQNTLPIEEQDRAYQANLKFLSWMYTDFDVDWVMKSFTLDEIAHIRNWAFLGVNGIKKDEKS